MAERLAVNSRTHPIKRPHVYRVNFPIPRYPLYLKAPYIIELLRFMLSIKGQGTITKKNTYLLTQLH